MKKASLLSIALASVAILNTRGATAPVEAGRPVDYSLSQGAVMAIPAQKAALPLYVYGEDATRLPPYVPSGYMGDGVALKIKSASDSAPLVSGRAGQSAMQVTYLPKGSHGWAGVYWLAPANNWARIKGAGFNLTRAVRLTFWMKGANGGEEIGQIKVGGIVGPYPDTDSAEIGPVTLKNEWTQYAIDLTGKDLRHIVGGFSFSIRRADNPTGAVFYLDEVRFEGLNEAQPEPEVDAAAAAPVAGAPVESVPAPVAPRLPETIRRTIPFAGGAKAFQIDGRAEIDDIVKFAVAYPNARILIEGHTDNTGAPAVNRKLSLERANAVAEVLVGAGISADRITTVGAGMDRPLTADSNKTPDGRRRNRRVEVTLSEEN